MAAVIRCDRCGKVGGPADFMRINAHICISAMDYSNRAEQSFDICRTCYDELFAFGRKGNKNEP